jgi:succinate dehydrogenase flavin-adding protein (antitoxin of CptAB toxin-antitoxin module)
MSAQRHDIESLMDDELQEFYEWVVKRHQDGDKHASVVLKRLHAFLALEAEPEEG